MEGKASQRKDDTGSPVRLAPATVPVPRHAPARKGAVGARPPWRRFLGALVVLGLIWAMLTDWRADAWTFGIPAVLTGVALTLLMPPNAGWRLSPRGALGFVLWFAVQSVRGAVDVAGRAFSPRMPLHPGFRRYPLTFHAGAPRVMFVNCITLLPGTLSAETADDEVIVHMLDTRADLQADLGVLEARIAALFVLD